MERGPRGFRLRAVALAAIFLGVALPAAPQKSTAAAPQKSAAAAHPDYSHQAAVIQSIRTAVSFNNDGTGTRDTTARVRVQSNAGVQRYGVLVFPYPRASERLDVDYVRVRQPDGTVVSTPPSAVEEVTSKVTLQAPEYSDYHEKHVVVKGLSPGSELEYHVQYRIIHPLVPGQFWFDYDFAKTGIVLDEELQVSVPAGRPVKVKSPGMQPVVTEQAGRRTYQWKSSNLKDVPVRLYPLGQLPAPSVLVSTFQSWDEVGRWWGGLEKAQAAPTPEIRAQAAKLTQSLTTEAQKIRAIYHYVATQFHYVSVSFGIGRYRPHAADDVLSNEYGDCKDQQTLLASLLQAAGISSWPALINSTRKIDADVPSPGQFDHVITVVPQGNGKLLWMDTTSQVAPLGFLTFNLRDKHALVIPGASPAHLAETPPELPQANQDSYSFTGKLASDGTLTAKMQGTATGDRGLLLRLAFRSVGQSKWKDVMQFVVSMWGYGGTVSNVTAGSPEDTDHPFKYSCDYTRKDYSDWKDHQTSTGLPPAGFPPVSDDPEKASQPVILGPLGETHEVSKIELPKGYTPTLPDAVDLVKPFAEYHAKYSFQKGVLREDREVIVKEEEIPLTQRDDYRTFQKAVSEDEGHFIPLSSGGETLQQAMENPAFSDAAREAGSDFREGNYDAAAAALGRATAAEPNSEQVWLMAGSMYMALQKKDEGIAALRKAVSLAPADPRPCRFLYHFLMAANRPEEALEVWKDFVSTNPKSADAHFRLAYTYGERKQYTLAVEEYQAAAKLDPKNSGYEEGLGWSLAKAGENAKAVAAFEDAVKLDPSPSEWNDAGYAMADAGLDLPEAEHWVSMAVEFAESRAAKVSLKDLQDKDLWPTNNLSFYWDSLGWVYFREGKTQLARKYVEASLDLNQDPAVADHLGQIDEKLGRRHDAIHEYALSVAFTPGSFTLPPGVTLRHRPSNSRQTGESPRRSVVMNISSGTHRPPVAAGRLHHLVGKGRRYSDAVARARDDGSQMRTYRFPKGSLKPGNAEFFVLVGAGGKATDVMFISGSENLRPASRALAALKYRQPIPDSSLTKLLRRGILSCSQDVPSCDFVLYTPSMVHSVQ